VNRHSRPRAARAERDSFYQPSLMAALLALALAFLLIWHGMARAENFASPEDNTHQPATTTAAPAGSGCTDDMDFSPEDNLPNPFDADTAAFRGLQAPLMGLRPTALNDRCQSSAQRPQQI
jgi:hypothetical protein